MTKQKNKPIAILLWFFFGFLGGHRFYLGSPWRGLIFIGLLVLGTQLDAAGRSGDQLVFYLIVLLWLYDLYWILSSLRSEASGELQETQRMSFLKKLFGKKESSGVPDLQDLGLEVEVSWGDDGEELSADDHCHNHCFIFYGLNAAAFEAIETQVQNWDGPEALSLLRSMEGVLMASLFEQPAGSEDVLGPRSELLNYISKLIDQNLEQISETWPSAIGADCVSLVQTEKAYIAGQIASAATIWSESDFFKKEDFIGAMLVFVKSSKSFDARDSVSDNQHGFNLPVVASGGFVRSCIYDCEEVINIKYGGDRIAEFWDYNEPGSDNPRNRYNYKNAFFNGRDITAPFGFNYFDQEGQLWCIEEISKAVTLVSEDEEATTEFYVSH